MIGNKFAKKITKVSKHSEKNNSQTVTNENDKEILIEIPKERYISPRKIHNISDDLRLIVQ